VDNAQKSMLQDGMANGGWLGGAAKALTMWRLLSTARIAVATSRTRERFSILREPSRCYAYGVLAGILVVIVSGREKLNSNAGCVALFFADSLICLGTSF